MSALPLISKVVASTSPATVKTPLVSVIKSVSLVCPIVVPLIITLSTVRVVRVPKLVMLDCAAVVTVAAVPDTLPVTSPVNGPAKASEVTVPSKYASLNSNELVPKSISLSVTGTIAPSCILICSTAAEDTSTNTPHLLFVLSATILFKKSKSPIVWILPPCPAVPSCLCPVEPAELDEYANALTS